MESGKIRGVRVSDASEWLRLRRALWPTESVPSLRTGMKDYLGRRSRAAFVVDRHGEGLGGFVEASIRPWAEGCTTRPVGYVEGWFVDVDLRRHGWGRALIRRAERWAFDHGCSEMGSDTLIGNRVGFAAHRALGYGEVSREILFRRRIAPFRSASRAGKSA